MKSPNIEQPYSAAGLLLGTSSFTADGWQGSFYPPGMQTRTSSLTTPRNSRPLKSTAHNYERSMPGSRPKKSLPPRDFSPRPGLSSRNRGVNAWVCPSKDCLANPSAKAAPRLAATYLSGG